MTPIGALHAEKIAESVLLYVFRISFPASLLLTQNTLNLRLFCIFKNVYQKNAELGKQIEFTKKQCMFLKTLHGAMKTLQEPGLSGLRQIASLTLAQTQTQN